jgi:hypothetical protein
MQGDDDKVPNNTNHVSLLVITDLRGYVAGRLDNEGRSAITHDDPSRFLIIKVNDDTFASRPREQS